MMERYADKQTDGERERELERAKERLDGAQGSGSLPLLALLVAYGSLCELVIIPCLLSVSFSLLLLFHLSSLCMPRFLSLLPFLPYFVLHHAVHVASSLPAQGKDYFFF